MISVIAIGNIIGSTFNNGGTPTLQKIVTEASDQIVTEASSQELIIE
tara:strand:+ start:1011 stop:1151 length:141 start_codon:yes stop_codon:yes gene_type:complete